MRIFYLFLLFLLIISLPASAQILEPAPTFHFIDPGYGAAALGMSGAFVAVANDLSAMYWNPAGLAQLPGLQLYVDYRHQAGSDEDFASEVTSGSFNSAQHYSLSGNQLQALSASYAFRRPGFTIVPAFAFQRLSLFSPNRDLKDAAERQFSTLDTKGTLTGLFKEKLDKGEDEFTFGVGASIGKTLFVGGAWSFLRDGPEETLTGNFESSINMPGLQTSETITINRDTKNKYTGNYLKLGVLAFPGSLVTLGGTIRLPYTRKNTFMMHTTGPFTQTDTFLNPDGSVNHVVVTQGNLDEGAGGDSSVRIPLEWSAGASLRPAINYLISGSITHANWKDAQETSPSVPYPTLRGVPGDQPSLLQWRIGFQYLVGEIGNGIALRTGYFRDGQPTGTANDRSFFKGYSVGIGYASRGLHVDVSWVNESGDFKLTPDTVGTSHVSNRRLVFGVGFSAD